MGIQAKEPLQYYQYDSGDWKLVDTGVIVEQPVTLTVNGEIWLELLCTPVDLEALAVGFLFNEGIIQSAEAIRHVEACTSGKNVDVWLSHAADRPKHWRRTSGCGGGMTSTDPESQPGEAVGTFCLTPEAVCALSGQLLEVQGLYREVRGVHTSALSDGERLLVVAEDVGRHNTIDKISGHCVLNGIFPAQRILLTTGRISSEMLQKASRLGAAMVVSRSSPTSLSVRLAQQLGITLIGYAHRDRFNVYTCPERVANAVEGICTEAFPAPKTIFAV